MTTTKLMNWAAAAIAISGVLHWVAIFTGTAGASVSALVIVGAVYLIFAYGLRKQMRWLAYLCFVIMLAGTVAALATSFESKIFLAIMLADLAAAIFLFIALWRDRPAA